MTAPHESSSLSFTSAGKTPWSHAIKAYDVGEDVSGMFSQAKPQIGI